MKDTPLLDGIRKQAGLGSLATWGMRLLQKNPRAGATALGGIIGGGAGLIGGGDLKSAVAGSAIGAAGGYGAARMGLNTSDMYRNARAGLNRFRRSWRSHRPVDQFYETVRDTNRQIASAAR